MQHHIKNAAKFGVKVVVAVNKFFTDTDAELALVAKMAMAVGAASAVTTDHWAQGGAGAVDLARAVKTACQTSRAQPSTFKFLYPAELSLAKKIETVCFQIYGT
jgi:methylenetetrahydrofolate dehydrogenase (NADP+)/methenyltetrahydrofolate cyclohydrolase/formyltetrahydrofolate synthetase